MQPLLTCSNPRKLLGAHNTLYNQYQILKCMDIRPGRPDYFSVMAHDHEWVDESSKEMQKGPNKEAAWAMLVRACISAGHGQTLDLHSQVSPPNLRQSKFVVLLRRKAHVKNKARAMIAMAQRA